MQNAEPAADALTRRAIDAAIHATAGAQHGVVSRAQLIAGGIPAHAIDRRLNDARFQHVHRGVYRVGPLTVPRSREMAAVLACGAGAAVSHASATALRHMTPPQTRRDAVEITVSGSARRIPGVRVHRCRLADGDIELMDGIAVTSAARTLLDIAVIVEAAELERAFAFAEREGLVRRAELTATIARYPRHRGAYRLSALVATDTEPPFTRSEAEARLIALIRRAQLRSPATNVRLHGFEVDLYWHAERLVVEVDGYTFHSSERAFEKDRRRDAVLAAAGIRVMRVTWRQIARDREATIARIAQALVRKQQPA